MDPQIEELKELVRQNIAISEDTNRVVHSVRRTARVGHFMQIMWWLIIIAASGYAYYYYQPYINQLGKLYTQIQVGGQQAQNLEATAQEFLKKLVPQNGTQAPAVGQ